MISPETSRVLVLDFGSQYTQLIARRIREDHIYCEIQSYNYSLENIRKFNPGGIILSGGPASVWVEFTNVFQRIIIRLDFAVDIGLPNTPGNQLRILGTKIENENSRRFRTNHYSNR